MYRWQTFHTRGSWSLHLYRHEGWTTGLTAYVRSHHLHLGLFVLGYGAALQYRKERT